MAGRKMNKTEGAHDKCFCGEPVVCVKKTYQGNDRLSWVNESDGESHYSRNDDGSFNCNTTIVEDPKNKKLTEAPPVGNAGTPTTAQKPSESQIISDIERIYRSLLPGAERTVREALYFGKQPTEHDVIVSTQCVMKSFVYLWRELTK